MKFLIAFILLFIGIPNSNAQNEFQKLFKSDSPRFPQSTEAVDNENYLIFGMNFKGKNAHEIFLINKCNQIEWGKQIYSETGNLGGSYSTSYVKRDGGFIICGGLNNIESPAYLVKLDSSLSIKWAKTYISGNYPFRRLLEMINGDFICVGGDSQKGYIVRINSDGFILWSKTYNIMLGSDPLLSSTKDNGVLIVGTNSLIKINGDGEVKWSKVINNIDFNCVQELVDGSFIVSGSMGQNKIPVLKVNKNGQTAWYKLINANFNVSINAISITLLSDNESLAIAGLFWTPLNSAEGFLLVMDTSANIRWVKGYGDAGYQHFRHVRQTKDSGFFIAAYSNGFSHNALTYYLIKTNSFGVAGCFGYDLHFTDELKQDVASDVNIIVNSISPKVADLEMKVRDVRLNEKFICTNQIPYADLGQDTTFCYGQSYTLDVGPRNPACTFLWSNGDTNTTQTFTQSGKYWVQITKDFCTHSDTIIVYFLPQEFVNLGKDTTVCKGEVITLDADTLALMYEWETPGNVIFNTRKITAKDSGLYIVKVTAKGGCVDHDSVYVNFFPMPGANAGPDTNICFGSSYSMQGSGGITYLWTPAKYLSDSTIHNPKADPPKTQRYWLITSNLQGCIDSATVLLKVKPPLQTKLSVKNKEICFGEKAMIETTETSGGNSAEYVFTWRRKDSSIISGSKILEFSPSSTETIYFSLNDGCSQTFYDSATVTVFALPSAEFTATDTLGCQPLPVKFIPNAAHEIGNKYEWNFGEGKIDTAFSPVYIYANAGKYFATLKVTNKYGCSASDTVLQSINIFPVPKADFEMEPQQTNIEAPHFQLKNLSVGAQKYIWFFGEGNTISSTETEPKHSFADTGNYSIKLIAENTFGCTDTTESIFRVNDIYRIYIPNTFSPNNDSINDLFFPQLTYAKSYELQIFNRWGEEVFRSQNIMHKWDGKFMGKAVQDDVYFYKLSVTDMDSRSYYYNGLVQLLK